MRQRYFVALLILAGCSKNADEPVVAPAAVSTAEQKPMPNVVQVLKPFREVIVDHVPDGESRPPDTTMAGKSVGKLYEQVASLFDQIKFVDSRGRKIKYFATVKTDLGDIRIELLSDTAPNQVRNFIALARAGYYDGLNFHRSVRHSLTGQPESFIEGGCPLGTGDLGYGSIGYWLRAEPSDDMEHDDGVVGAFHSQVPRGDMLEDIENGACKFYIALSKAKWRDQSFTIFGKVIQGLNTAHTINERPNLTERGSEERPVQPVVIRQVIVDEVVAGGAQIASRE